MAITMRTGYRVHIVNCSGGSESFGATVQLFDPNGDIITDSGAGSCTTEAVVSAVNRVI